MRTGIEKAENEFDEIVWEIKDKIKKFADEYNIPEEEVTNDVIGKLSNK